MYLMNLFLHPHHFHIDHNATSLPPPHPPPPKKKFAQLLLGITGIPREIEDNGYANFWG